MYLADKCGWPYEKRKGHPVHNFVRACILILRGRLWFKPGEYKPAGFTAEERANRVVVIEDFIVRYGSLDMSGIEAEEDAESGW